jgi:AAA15 family ATPase/GTPase
MLKRYTVENFSSFSSKNSLDFTAGRNEENLKHIVNFEKVKILKSAVLYGANASGKSNLIKSMDYAKKIILKSLTDVDTYKKYFRLDKESSKKPTQFEFQIEVNDKFFSYGFNSLLQNKTITEEWLYEIGNNKPEMIFERKNNEITLGQHFKKNKKLRNRFEIYADDMKNQNEQLFLSEIASKGLDITENPEVEIINSLYNWFNKKLIILYPNSKNGAILSSVDKDDSMSKIFKKYLKEFDTGVMDISSIEDNFEDCKEFPDAVKKELEKELLKDEKAKATIQGPGGILLTVYREKGNIKVRKLGFIHNIDIEEVFELKDESDGTKRLFDLIPLIEKFDGDTTIVIDEFDRSLHPKLTRKFFELFYSIENSKSQLIITTHESTLLNLDLLRRDEIWFVEKDKLGASNLSSLNQFKVRYDSKIEKAYLLGRYGAIPLFKTFDEMNLDK